MYFVFSSVYSANLQHQAHKSRGNVQHKKTGVLVCKQSQEGNGPIIQNLLKTIASKMLPKCAQNRFSFKKQAGQEDGENSVIRKTILMKKKLQQKNSQEQQPNP